MSTPLTPSQLLSVLRAGGLTVIEVDGWERRCRCCPDTEAHRPTGPWNMADRGWGTLHGGVQHITGGGLAGRTPLQYIASIINGDPELPVKAQFVTAPNGDLYLNSAGRCNHAGKVGAKVEQHMIDADFSTTDDYDDRYRGAAADGNAFTLGNECIAAVTMTAAQRATSVLLWATLAKHFEWTGQEIVGHGEVSSARVKADPNLDMGKFRKDIMAAVKSGSVPAPTDPKPDPDPSQTAPVAVWGKPATFVIGATGADATKLGERIVVWSKALGLKSPYKVGPGSPIGPADVAGLSALQVAWGFGSTKADLAKGGNSDGYPGPATFAKLEADPPAKTTPKPHATETLTVLFLPMAGYNADTAKGVKDWEKNTDGLAALVKKYKPDLVGTTELSDRKQDKMLPRFEKALPNYSKDDSGSDGRYVFRNKDTTNNVASGVVTANKDTELDDDNKQAAWSVNKTTNGTVVGMISAHTENQDGVDKAGANKGENADDLRVEQTQSMVHRGTSQIRAHGAKDEHTIVVADTNSVSMVKDFMVSEGWTPVGPGYFHGWDDHTKKSFDWAFVKGDATAIVKVIDHKFSDHTALLITWTFPV